MVGHLFQMQNAKCKISERFALDYTLRFSVVVCEAVVNAFMRSMKIKNIVPTLI